MPRVSRLENTEFAKAVAEAYINGCTHTDMADMFGASKDSISKWVRDPRVQAHSAKMAQDRVLRITRKIDKEIDGRLQDAHELDTEVLLKIRKEFLDRTLITKSQQGAHEDAGTIGEAVTALENDETLAKALKELMKGGD